MAIRPGGTHAFTVIEIVGVLGILALLLAMALPVLQQTRAKSRHARAQADISRIEAALNLYAMDYGSIPTAQVTSLILMADSYYTILSPASPILSPSAQEPFLAVPLAQQDPLTHQFVDPWKAPYWIRPTAVNNPSGFDIFSAGPDRTRQTADDINNWSR